MATCDLGFDHEDAAPVVAEPEPAVVVEPGPNENDVKIAEIQAAASVEETKLYTEQRGSDLELEVERLRGELGGIRQTLATLAPAPEPEPEPVVVPVPAGPAEPEAGPPAPPETSPPAAKSGGKSPGWWDMYH